MGAHVGYPRTASLATTRTPAYVATAFQEVATVFSSGNTVVAIV